MRNDLDETAQSHGPKWALTWRGKIRGLEGTD